MKRGLLRTSMICFACLVLFFVLPGGVLADGPASGNCSEAVATSSPATDLPQAAGLHAYWGLLIWFIAAGGLLLAVRITELYPRKK